jgi:hypothetical protein
MKESDARSTTPNTVSDRCQEADDVISLRIDSELY